MCFGRVSLMSNRRTTRAWPEIVAQYRALVEVSRWPFGPMAALVEHLAGSRYAASLFPCTSHEILLLGRVPDFESGDGELQVLFDGARQRFTFTYVQRSDDRDPWSRECEASEWPRVLERILHKRLQWFHEG